MQHGPFLGPPDEKAFMEKINKKAEHMKAAGASSEEINKMVTEAKKKWAEMMAKAKKKEKKIKTKKMKK